MSTSGPVDQTVGTFIFKYQKSALYWLSAVTVRFCNARYQWRGILKVAYVSNQHLHLVAVEQQKTIEIYLVSLEVERCYCVLSPRATEVNSMFGDMSQMGRRNILCLIYTPYSILWQNNIFKLNKLRKAKIILQLPHMEIMSIATFAYALDKTVDRTCGGLL